MHQMFDAINRKTNPEVNSGFCDQVSIIALTAIWVNSNQMVGQDQW